MHPMRRLMQISEGENIASGIMPHLDRILENLQDGPRSPNELGVSVRDMIALANPNYVRPVEGEKTILTSKDCRWQLTPLGYAYLKKQDEQVVEDASANQDGEESPLTRKRKRPTDPSDQTWFKELFSKRG